VLAGLFEKRPKKQNEDGTRKHNEEHLPFAVKSILELCWGLTLNLSHETQQQDLGKIFAEQFTQIFAKHEKNPEDAVFLENLVMALAKTVRNIGFVRENHVRYLEYTAQEFTEKMRNLNDAADFTSFSGSGLYSKIVSFLGIGSLADLVSSVGQSLTLILLFFVAGVIGALMVTLMVRAYHSDKRKKNMETMIEDEQNNYWVTKFKPGMVDQLYILFSETKALIEKYYPEKDAMINNDDLLRMSMQELKDVIRNDILPPDSLTWPPYLEKNIESVQGKT